MKVMKAIEEIKAQIEAAVTGAQLELVLNPSPSAQHSLVVDHAHAVAVAKYLRDAADLQFDFCSNVSGVDWLDREVSEKVKVSKVVDGAEQEVEETVKRTVPGYLESVYHLYSMALGHGPLVLRLRTANRTDQVEAPSLTPIWRSAELQEREVFDLYGIVFTGHPDLRRLLMWDAFKDHPMRRDYVEPDDFEYEPTAHDQVLKRAAEHRAQLAATEERTAR
ncbi:NADH-quinone oxidoreductase subunit C [Telmatobacter bradus]|uniref:NADH-quinone oxidoreductase subunit C n=1 Tax=Telmatobacter bradus TaxID=474953 RepID=UPI003B427FFB